MARMMLAVAVVFSFGSLVQAGSITYNESSAGYTSVDANYYPYTWGSWDNKSPAGSQHFPAGLTVSFIKWPIDFSGMSSITSANFTLSVGAANEFPSGNILQAGRGGSDWAVSPTPDPRPSLDCSIVLNLVSNGADTQTFDLKDLVQGWLANPSTNYGFAFTSTNTDWPATTGCYRFTSPSLTITFAEASVPEPATMMLLGTGAVGLLGRARRRVR